MARYRQLLAFCQERGFWYRMPLGRLLTRHEKVCIGEELGAMEMLSLSLLLGGAACRTQGVMAARDALLRAQGALRREEKEEAGALLARLSRQDRRKEGMLLSDRAVIRGSEDKKPRPRAEDKSDLLLRSRALLSFLQS